jgi:hypothetical protein
LATRHAATPASGHSAHDARYREGFALSAGTVLTIDSGETVKVIGVTITRGTGIHGGGIENAGSLTLKGGAVSRDFAQDGGGIWNDHSLTLNDSTISENAAATKGAAFGRGIDNVGGSVTLNDSTISHNEAKADWAAASTTEAAR